MWNSKKKQFESVSINRKISSLKIFFKFSKREGLFFLIKDPTQSIKLLSTKKRLPSFLSESVMNDLFESKLNSQMILKAPGIN